MNQILIADKIYVTPEMKRKRRLYKIMYILSLMTVIALLVYYVYAEKERNDQESLGKEILQQVDNTTIETKAIVIALDNNDENEDQLLLIDDDNELVQQEVTASDGGTYNAEAVLSYPKLDINYSVLSEESEDLLKVSLCKYWGPNPNSIGNYCIVGHNYKSGKMFGNLSDAETGDEIILKDFSGNSVKYAVYNMYIVEPTDVSCTSQLTNGKRELTLITCTNYGQQRFIVKAREV